MGRICQKMKTDLLVLVQRNPEQAQKISPKLYTCIMRTFAISLLLLLPFQFLIAQSKARTNKRVLISANLGLASWQGDFSESDLKVSKEELVRNGRSFQFEIGYLLRKNLGVSAVLGGLVFPVNKDPLIEAYREEYNLDLFSLQMEAQPFVNRYAMLALQKFFPIGKFLLELEPMFGISTNSAYTAELKIIAPDELIKFFPILPKEQTLNAKPKENKYNSYCANLGLGLKFMPKPWLGIGLKFDFFHTAYDYQIRKFDFDNLNFAIVEEGYTNESIVINSLNPSLSMEIRF